MRETEKALKITKISKNTNLVKIEKKNDVNVAIKLLNIEFIRCAIFQRSIRRVNLSNEALTMSSKFLRSIRFIGRAFPWRGNDFEGDFQQLHKKNVTFLQHFTSYVSHIYRNTTFTCMLRKCGLPTVKVFIYGVNTIFDDYTEMQKM